MVDKIRELGVVGLGVMGSDIAFLYAMKGYPTLAYDASKTVMQSLTDRREQTIERLKRRNRISDHETESVRTHLAPAARLESMAEANLITEAVLENTPTKLGVYRDLKASGFQGILTSNTSSITRATLLVNKVYDRGKFALTHFFNPVLYTQMVEVVTGDMKNADRDLTLSLLKSLGRSSVETHDISGFVSNSILMIYAVMALRLLEDGARIEEVDQAAKAMRLLPPFISFDSWKPSIVEDVTRVMFELRGDPFLRSSQSLSLLAKENPKFYVDQKPSDRIYQFVEVRAHRLGEAIVKQALKIALWIAAARVVELGESPDIVDHISTEGLKTPEQPLKEIDTIGAAGVLEQLAKVNQELSGQPLTPPALLAAMAREGQPFFLNDKANPWLLSQRAAIHHASH
jgi:3-hydroxybutyryl-CoA dehydrogenase